MLFSVEWCRNCTHTRRREAAPSMLQAAGDPCAAQCRRIRKTAAAWERAKHKVSFLSNSRRPVRLTTPIFVSLVHKTTTLPSRGPPSLVWVRALGVYSTVASGRRPCAWGCANATGSSKIPNICIFPPHETTHFCVILRFFLDFAAILLLFHHYRTPQAHSKICSPTSAAIRFWPILCPSQGPPHHPRKWLSVGSQPAG